MGSAIPAVVDAVPRPGASAAERLAASQESEGAIKIVSRSLFVSVSIQLEFAFVKDRRRNRLAHSKANKLVGLFHNLRLLKRMRQVTYAEPAIAWTDDLEQSSVTKFEPAAIGSTSALVPRL